MKRKVILSFGSFSSFFEENRRTIVMIIAAAMILTVLTVIKDELRDAKYIEDESGNVIGVYRKNADEDADFPLHVRGEKDGAEYEADIDFYLNGKTREKAKDDAGPRQEESFVSEVEGSLSGLSDSRKKKVMLPGSLESGTDLTWSKGEERSGYIIILLAPLLIYFMYVYSEKKKKEAIEKRRMEVERELPDLADEVLMMMDSGLIISDAFHRIADGYRKRREESILENEIIGIDDEVVSGKRDLVSTVIRHADELGVSSFSKLAQMIKDDMLIGIDISRRLREESAGLWETRKRLAVEQGKIAESRLTIPLGILLLVLILITVAPAMIQVEGG